MDGEAVPVVYPNESRALRGKPGVGRTVSWVGSGRT